MDFRNELTVLYCFSAEFAAGIFGFDCFFLDPVVIPLSIVQFPCASGFSEVSAVVVDFQL